MLRFALLLPLVVLVPSLAAQTVSVPVAHRRVVPALAAIESDNAWTLAEQVSLCEIPAPPFKEAARAASFSARLAAQGLVNIRTDTEGNVIAERPGSGGGPRVLISAHLDTVFPEGTDVSVTRTGTRYAGPGIGDDCRGLAVLLQVAKAMAGAGIQTTGDVIFVGTVGEEGEGNLRGVRHLFSAGSAGKIDYFISVDGAGFDATIGAVGSHRYRITYEGPGGHSYGAFGMPNPMHAMGRAMAEIAEFKVPTSPKTTFSVGIVSGGTSVNSIPFSATMEVDLRSESQAELDRVDGLLQAAVQAAVVAERNRWPDSQRPLTVKVEDMGKRPAGAQADSAYIARVSLAAARAMGTTTSLSTSSTDSNIPISLGVPAVTIDGGGRGGGSHSLTEWYDDGERGWQGPQ
ncbi:MAG: M20/M25/M40 family metallo-hydrolase, partial [Gemmatimonadota bacterium]|nr:M20/M25/M40 family metallo-hydrolase [Gemmatimonadota bacterium]